LAIRLGVATAVGAELEAERGLGVALEARLEVPGLMQHIVTA